MRIVEHSTPHDYQELIEVWEASVRATHHFLKDEDILYFKPLILEKYFDLVQLTVVKDASDAIVGFSGVAENNLEMLFIHPDQRGQGVGKMLLQHAIQTFKITHVDVNEENEQALGFYQKFGFTVVGRSATDPTGKPYPILHLEMK